MDEEWKKSFIVIKGKHDSAYSVIDQAIRSEEAEKPEVALAYYQKGIELIDDALATPVGVPDTIDDTWEKGCRMIHKMKRTRAEVALRVTTLSKKYQPATADVVIPCASTSMSFLSSIDLTKVKLELLFSCDKVNLYKIKPNGTVSTSVGDSVLRIVRMAEDETRNLSATIFLQVIKSSKVIKIKKLEDNLETAQTDSGFTMLDMPSPDDESFSWIYPLVTDVSPCFRTDYGAFILPDIQSEENGSAIGIVIPSPADEIVLEILEEILGRGVIHHQKEGGIREPRSTATTVSENIIKGAYYVSNGLIRGAEKAGELMSTGTPYLLSKLNKAPDDDSPGPVTDKVRTGVEIAKSVTGTAVQLTGYIVSKCGSATLALGRFLAPHVQTHGSRLLSQSTGMSKEAAAEKVSDILTVAAGAIEGVGTVYTGLEQSASILGTNLANNSVKIIEHKYGASAANVAGTTFDTVGNVINITHNVNYMTPKGFVKKTAKGTGLAIMEDFKPKPGTNYIAAGSLYPDLSELAKEIEIGESSNTKKS